jgi:hypothetical protein
VRRKKAMLILWLGHLTRIEPSVLNSRIGGFDHEYLDIMLPFAFQSSFNKTVLNESIQ